MKPIDFSLYLSNFLTKYIAGQRNLSQNTVRAYRNVFILLLQFCRDYKGIVIEKIKIETINVDMIECFLEYLENDRHCTPRTLNHRLATLHAFFRYLQVVEPACLLQCQRILSIPLRRFVRPVVDYISKEHLAVLLSVLYDTGARVQELIDLTIGDLRLESPEQVRLLGKGRKIRIVPLMDNTVTLLRNYLYENNLTLPEKFDYPLFQNKQGNKLTRAGVNYILHKYARMVQEIYPQFKQNISPHTLRHTKGMHLLHGGVSLDIIRDFLGHADMKTTEIYARANIEMKREALEKISASPVPKIPSWKQNKSLLQWLQSL